MSSSVFENSSSYAPGVSTGMPTDALQFLQNFTNKKGKIKRKAFREFKEGGGDVQGVRDILEGKAPADFEGPLPQYTAGQHVTQSIQDATASLDNVKKGKNDRPRVKSFIDEFATARGKISHKDMRAFEEAGGNLTALDRRLQKGNFTREEMLEDPSVLNERGTAIQTGQDDYYTGEAGKRFLDNKLRKMGAGTDEGGAETELVTNNPPTGGSDGADGSDGSDGADGSDGTTGGTTTPEDGTGTETTPIPVLPTDNPYPAEEEGYVDPGSGFPTNPGRHVGAAFTPYKENISDILKHTDERLDRIRQDRKSPEDTLTASYTQQLIDGGILPGSEGYVSAADKDKARLEGDLAIKDAFAKEVVQERREAFDADMASIRANATARRQGKSEELWGEGGKYDQMQEKLLRTRPKAPTTEDGVISILAYAGTDPRAPIDNRDKSEPDKGDKDDNGEMNYMPDLPDSVKGAAYGQPGLYNDGPSAPDYNKKTSWDGGSFENFLKQTGTTEYRPGKSGIGQIQTNYISKSKNDLYQRLKAEGLSDEDMKEAARAAGLTNVRTGKEGKSDFDQIIEAYNNNFYKDFDGKELKSAKDLYRWYESKGGEKSLNQIMNKMPFKNMDSKSEADKFAQYIANDLRKSGIRMDPDKDDMKAFDAEMDRIADMFGGKYTFSTYQEALKGNKASDVNDWLSQYMKLGGGVGQRVIDAMKDQG